MRLSEHLYLGDTAKKRRFSVLSGLRSGKFQPEVYVITPPENASNVLTVYPAWVYGSRRVRQKDPLVLGLAVTWPEALEVVRRMVDDSYRATGGFYPDEWKG